MLPLEAIDRSFSGNVAPLPVRARKPSVKIEFRCMSGIKAQVERIVRERIFNFPTASDFYRRAVWNQLLLCKEMTPKLSRYRDGNHMSWMEACVLVMQNSEKRRERQTMVAYLDREVDALKRAGNEADARKLVLTLVNLIADSGPDDTDKRKTLKHIRAKHLDLLIAPSQEHSHASATP